MPWFQIVQILVLTVVALVGLPATVYMNYSVRIRRENEAKRLLDVLDKLPEEAAGHRQIKAASDRSALELAYILEFPRTIRDKRPPVVFGVLMIACGAVAVYLSQSRGSSWVSVSLSLLQFVFLYFFRNAFVNSVENNRLTRGLFVELNAPKGLVHASPGWLKRVHQPVLSDALSFGAAVRDRTTDRFMTSVEAMNLGAEEVRSELKRLIREGRILKLQNYGLRLYNVVFRPVMKIRIYIVQLRTRRVMRKLQRANPSMAAQLQAEFDELAAQRPI